MTHRVDDTLEQQPDEETLPEIDLFALWVRTRRHARNLSRKALAAKSNIAYASIRAIEEGQYRPRDGQAEALAKQLHWPPEDQELFVELFVAVARRRIPVDALPPADRLQANLAAGEPSAAITLLPRPACPYPGMRAFKREEWDGFFGRAQDIQALRDKLATAKCAIVIGPSGSGKSSLLQAGLIPMLSGSSAFGGRAWEIVDVRLGQTPLQSLERHLALFAAPNAAERKPAMLACAYQERTNWSHNLLVVVDPLEELFTHAPEETQPLLGELRALAEVEQCYVATAIRADFYHELMTPQQLPWIQARRVEITRLNNNQLEEAIVEPARRVGVTVDMALLERLKRDVADEPGVLPLLQVTLERLWDKVSNQHLTLQAYLDLAPESSSPLYRVLADQADATLSSLSDSKRVVAWRIFLRLVQFGEGRANTRRQQHRRELPIVGEDEGALDFVLDQLKDARLLTMSKDAEGHGVIDVTHEALLSHWALLVDMLARHREAELTRRRLEALAARWQERGRQSGLLTELDLADLEGWQTSAEGRLVGCSEILHEYIAHSAEAAAALRHELAKLHEQRLQERARAQERERQLLRASQQRLLALLVVFGTALIAVSIFVARREVLRASALWNSPLVPVGTVGLDVEQFEVTNERYRWCVSVGVCRAPANTVYLDHAYDQFPVTNVTYADADTFCRWIGRRLPTIEEWYVALNVSDPALLMQQSDAYVLASDIDRVALSPSSVSSAQNRLHNDIADLIGNVWEWTSSPAPGETDEWRQVVGLSYTMTRSSLGYAENYAVAAIANTGRDDIGLRCVADTLAP
jgi:formylglycine-generating enzyme required for sulfatase activity/transcriptional regulator with XRE-family HTH domain/energy-coupling factor transporter ATP-binding protein EcfA2